MTAIQITSIKSPPEGCELWSGMATYDGERFRWFIKQDGSDLAADLVETFIDGGEVLNLAIFNQDPPPGAAEAILTAIRRSHS